MPLPLSDISQAHRSDPERTEQALAKVGVKVMTNHKFGPPSVTFSVKSQYEK